MTKAKTVLPAPPRLPDELTVRAPDPADIDGDSWFQLDLSGAELSGATGSAVEIEQCRLDRVRLPGGSLARANVIDCVIGHSDLANLAVDRSGMRRVELTECRGTGMSWLDGVLRDVVFRDCRLDITNWRATRFTAVRFVGCEMVRADFYGADLRGVQFDECVLTGAQFSDAKLSGARFAGCELSGIGGVASMAGATIRSDDLFALTELLAGALDITVEPVSAGAEDS